MNIWFTPYHMNDDWFFLWAGISYNKAYLLTNDKLRDHVSKISEDNLFYNSLSRWIENNVVCNFNFFFLFNINLYVVCISPIIFYM